MIRMSAKFFLLGLIATGIGAQAATKAPPGETYPVGCFVMTMQLPIGDGAPKAIGKVCTEEKITGESEGDGNHFKTGEFTITMKDLDDKILTIYKMGHKVWQGPGAGIDRVIYSTEKWTKLINDIEEVSKTSDEKVTAIGFEMLDDNPEALDMVEGVMRIGGLNIGLAPRKIKNE